MRRALLVRITIVVALCGCAESVPESGAKSSELAATALMRLEDCVAMFIVGVRSQCSADDACRETGVDSAFVLAETSMLRNCLANRSDDVACSSATSFACPPDVEAADCERLRVFAIAECEADAATP